MLKKISIFIALMTAVAAAQNSLSDLRTNVSRLEVLLADYPEKVQLILPDLQKARLALIGRLEADLKYFSEKSGGPDLQATIEQLKNELTLQKSKLTASPTAPPRAAQPVIPERAAASAAVASAAPPASNSNSRRSQPAAPGPSPSGRMSECNYADELAKVKKLPAGSTDRRSAIDFLLQPSKKAACFANLLVGPEQNRQQQVGFSGAIKAFERLRTDKQAGSSSGTGGTSSLVSKGVTAQVFSLAAEYGALRESVNGQVVTLQGSLEAVPAILVRQRILPYCPSDYSPLATCLNQPLFRFLRRISYSASFNTTQNGQSVTGTATGGATGTAQPATFVANQRQLASAGGRVMLWSTRDATSQEFQQQWSLQLKQQLDLAAAGDDLVGKLQSLLGDLEDSPQYSAWFKDTEEQLLAASDEQLDIQWAIAASKLVDLARVQNPAINDRAQQYGFALRRFRFEEDSFVESLASKPVLTFEYNNNRPANQDPMSTFRLIFDKGIGKWAVTANGAIEIYDSRPSTAVPGSGRVRDAQLGMQVDRNLGALPLLGTAAMTAAYYFQYQNSPAIINVTPGTPLPGITFIGLPATATQAFAQKGNLHIFQWKLVLGEGSVRFPLSVSYSNRTELITKPAWRGQLGISYDFDSLFAK